jgi:hypothetical protein
MRVNPRNTFDVRMDYGHDASARAGAPTRRLSFGAALQPLSTTRLNLRMSNSASDALWLQGSRSIMASVDQQLPWRHHLVFLYQSRSNGSAYRVGGKAYRVDYVMPIGIPLRSSGETGRITVHLRRGDSDPAAGLLVQVDGQSRLTDRDGLVSFNGVTTGEHMVTIAPDSVGAGFMPVPAFPRRVLVKAGKNVDVTAALVRAGRINGTVQRFETTSGAATNAGQANTSTRQGQSNTLTAAAGIPNALIELQINEEHRTTVTDAAGAFAFDDVPPGQWHLRVVRADVPAFYMLEDSAVTVGLAPGQMQHVVLRVVPKRQEW